MPVSISVPIRHFSQVEFGKVAYEVVGHAYEVHSTLGRFFHESIYRSTLRQIFAERALDELQICLLHQGYRKVLYLDFLVDFGCPFELKTVNCLSEAHRSQLIQYLMLTGLSHGKLINFGSERFEQLFVNCHESLRQRQQFCVQRVNWPDSNPALRLEKIIVPLVQDWGTGLTKSVYQDAVLALSGGMEHCHHFTETNWQNQRTGRQPVFKVDGTMIELSCIRHGLEIFESHLHRFINHTTIDEILWINIASGCVRLQRITR